MTRNGAPPQWGLESRPEIIGKTLDPETFHKEASEFVRRSRMLSSRDPEDFDNMLETLKDTLEPMAVRITERKVMERALKGAGVDLPERDNLNAYDDAVMR